MYIGVTAGALRRPDRHRKEYTGYVNHHVENILRQIDQLPPVEQSRLARLLEERHAEQCGRNRQAPRDKRLPTGPAVDDTRERAWIKEHRTNTQGNGSRWMANRLIAAARVVWKLAPLSKPIAQNAANLSHSGARRTTADRHLKT